MQKTVWIKMKVMHSAAEYLITIITMNKRVRETQIKMVASEGHPRHYNLLSACGCINIFHKKMNMASHIEY